MGSGAEGRKATNGNRAGGAGLFERYVDGMSAAMAMTRGPRHVLVYANPAFAALSDPSCAPVLGLPVADAISGRDTTNLVAALDGVVRTGAAVEDGRIGAADDAASDLIFSVWPERADDGEQQCLIELRVATEAEVTAGLRRDLAEQMLLAALRERDAADASELSRVRAAFLAAEGRKLAESLDEDATLDVMSRLSLPELGAWGIVDFIDAEGVMRRRSVTHPDPGKQAALHDLDGIWVPQAGDAFGIPAVLLAREPLILGDGTTAVLATDGLDSRTLGILRSLEIGPMLTVPLVVHDKVVAAITFVGTLRHAPFTAEDIELARDLASRSAMALDNARLHGEAVVLRKKAEAASEAKGAFLGTMGHELRTPLNAIAGYVDLIDMGLRGPVTEAQHSDLARIRGSQRHLTTLVSDILNFVRIGKGSVIYSITDIAVDQVFADSVALVEPLVAARGLSLTRVHCGPAIGARADRARVTQILVNLLSNAIKFTPSGGRIDLGCDPAGDAVHLRVRDTGLGIPQDKLGSIFEPFVQVRSALSDRDAGVGLGLTISRDLARGMGGDLTVASKAGAGSTFTLTLPIAGQDPGDGSSV